jgi:Ca2+-binding EF-hand superfamily protein
LQTFFNLMDSNSDGQITLAEFKQKIKMLTSILDDGEINTLFQAIDRQSAGHINYNLFSQEFPEITSKPNEED